MTNSPSSSAHAVPTAPGRVPLLGHIPSVLRHSPVATLRSLQAYGDIVALHLGPATVYVVNSPDLIHRMLVTEADNYRKGRLFTRSADMVGNGIANSDGEFHHRQRRLISPAFHRTRMRAYGDVMRGQTEAISDAWQPGTVLPLEKEMNRLTARVTAKTLFTSELGDRAVAEVQETVPIMTKEAMRRVMVPDVINRLPTPGNRRFFAAIARIRKVLDEVISAYEEQGVDHGDLLSVLLRARDEETGEGMTHVQVRDELVTLLAAGDRSHRHRPVLALLRDHPASGGRGAAARGARGRACRPTRHFRRPSEAGVRGTRRRRDAAAPHAGLDVHAANQGGRGVGRRPHPGGDRAHLQPACGTPQPPALPRRRTLRPGPLALRVSGSTYVHLLRRRRSTNASGTTSPAP